LLLCVGLLTGSHAHAFGQISESLIDPDLPQSQEFRLIEQPGHNVSRQYAPYFVQDQRLRSRSDVVREIKNKYDAEVLKISLNEKRTMYRVRVLMPSGRVRVITVNARA